MAIVDRHGLLPTVTILAANHHEVTLVQATFDFYMIEAKPDKMTREQGIEMIAPHRSTRELKTQDGWKLRRYKRRGSLSASLRGYNGNGESWWEYYLAEFLSFVQLGAPMDRARAIFR